MSMTEGERMQLAQRVAAVREQMAQAARQAGRDPADIHLCAVCKGHASGTVALSADLAIDCFGENRMQEMRVHLDDGAYGGKPCHFIGHLQTNKVRQVVGSASLIQSVDSLRLLRAIGAEAERRGIVQDILLQLNIGDEQSKTGAAKDDLWPLLEGASALQHVQVRGLMAIPPAFDNSPDSRRWFAMLRRLYEQAIDQGAPMDTLSMGMTDSFIAAIQEGATLVRVGRAIYGERGR